MIDWDKTTREDEENAKAVIDRIINESASTVTDRMSLHMDLVACHTCGCPLDWDKLKTGRMGDVIHDVAGITLHINRETGRLGDCFHPRFAKRQHTSSMKTDNTKGDTMKEHEKTKCPLCEKKTADMSSHLELQHFHSEYRKGWIAGYIARKHDALKGE